VTSKVFAAVWITSVAGHHAIWLSPIFPSPMADFGYDVADYCDVDPVFGSLPEFDPSREAHQRHRSSRLGAEPT
jgi:maltooligosyltrehalose synthase